MFHLKKSTDGQYYFTIVAFNYEPLMTSELYRQRQSALKGMRAVLQVFERPPFSQVAIAQHYQDETTGIAVTTKFPSL